VDAVPQCNDGQEAGVEMRVSALIERDAIKVNKVSDARSVVPEPSNSRIPTPPSGSPLKIGTSHTDASTRGYHRHCHPQGAPRKALDKHRGKYAAACQVESQVVV